MNKGDPELAAQVIRELQRISPAQEQNGFWVGGLDLRELLEALRSVPSGAGELGIAEVMARLLDQPDED